MVRLGIIGLGNISRIHQRSLENTVERCKLTAVCDVDPSRLERFNDQKDVRQFTDSVEMIRSGEVDAVLICTPHYGHTTVGVDALEQGLHVLTEKPISVHKADAERLVAAHKGGKQVFAAMFQMRTDPIFAAVKRIVERGDLGELRRVNWIITKWFRSYAYYASGGWRATWAGEGGGVLLNQCPHNLDILQWICGMPSRVRGFCALGKYHDIEVEDDVTAYLEYPNGATGVFVTTTGESPGTNRFEVVGENGNLVVEGGQIVFHRNEVPTTRFSRESKERFGGPVAWRCEIPPHGKGGGHAAILQNFVDAILDGAPLIAPASEGINSVELGNAMLYSSLLGETIDMPLDGAAFEAKMKELIAHSTHEKKIVEAGDDDFAKSFN